MDRLKKIYQYYGLHGFIAKLQHRFIKTYSRFLKSEHIPTYEQMQAELATFAYLPLVSVITPLYQPDLGELSAYFVALLENNGYENIELCLVNDGAIDAQLDVLIGQYQTMYPGRIHYQANTENCGIAAASNDALALATGEYVALVDQDDVIAPHAFFEYIKEAQVVAYDFFYSDEDMISVDGKRFNPAFKPGWSPHTLLSRMYVNHLSMYKKKIIERVGGFRSAFDGCQDYDLLLRASVHFSDVCHVPKMLYHWRTSKTSIATSIDNKEYIIARAEAALREHLANQDLVAQANQIDDYLIYNIAIKEPKAKLNTIIFHVQDSVTDVSKSWSSLINNINANEAYDIYVIATREDLATDVVGNRHNVIKVDSLKDALRQIRQNERKMTEQVLFFTSDVEFIENDTLAYLLQLMQIRGIDVLAPTVVNQDMMITEAGRIILSPDTLAFSSFGVLFGENNYFGNNLSLVNYTFVSPDCFIMTKDLLQKITDADDANNFMEVLINLRSHVFFNCVNVGNSCVRRVEDSFEKIYRRPHTQKIKIEEKFYNKNLVSALGLLYKPKG